MPEEEHSTTDLKTPEEWQKITGITILDADGWGGKNGRPFTDPIGYVEWNERMSVSTVRREEQAGLLPFKTMSLKKRDEVPDRIDVVKKIMADFESAYVYFLLEQKINDGPVVRAAYYAACEKIVRKDVLPDRMLQSSIEQRLSIIKNNALDEFQESIELMFAEVANTTRKS